MLHNKPISPYAFLLCFVPVAGCQSVDLATCDMQAAKKVYFNLQGAPAYSGQAIIQNSCGNGGFCHSKNAVKQARYGAPAGMDFDMMAITSLDAADSETEILREGWRSVFERREEVYHEVNGGRMPPGEIGASLESSASIFRSDDEEEIPLSTSDAGVRALRNWLACKTPIIERTNPHPDLGYQEFGDIVAAKQIEPPDPVFSSIQEKVLTPGCVSIPDCHDSRSRAAELDLSAGAAFENLTMGSGARGYSCENKPYISTENVEDSLLLQKLIGEDVNGDPVCGSLMPITGSPLNDEVIAAIRQWIEQGAQNN